ncbi:hypothetical protein L1887_24645 [Cichorium endivia]|nr:hypothetical protein L1887_24645 [Cichorium endivia]
MECFPRLLLEVLNGSPDLRDLASRGNIWATRHHTPEVGSVMQPIAPSVEENTKVEQNYRYNARCCKIAAPVVAAEISLEVPDVDSAAARLDDLASILHLLHHKLALPPSIDTAVAEVVVVVTDVGFVVV